MYKKKKLRSFSPTDAEKKESGRNKNWNVGEIKFLLHARYIDNATVNSFLNAKPKHHTTKCWEDLASLLNSKSLNNVARSGENCLDKTKNLKRDYAKIITDLEKTGNSEDNVAVPKYWDLLREVMGLNPNLAGTALLSSSCDKKKEIFSPTAVSKTKKFDRNYALNDISESFKLIAESYKKKTQEPEIDRFEVLRKEIKEEMNEKSSSLMDKIAEIRK